MTPGYEEGNPPVAPDDENGVFMDWGGINPDDASQLGTVKFEGAMAAVKPIGKLAALLILFNNHAILIKTTLQVSSPREILNHDS